MPTGQVFLTAPLSIARSSTSASAARPRIRVGARLRRRGLLARARIAEIAIGDARASEEEHLEEPVDDDRGLAEEEGAVKIRREQDVVEHQQRDRHHACRTENIEKIRQRREAPFGVVEMKERVDEIRHRAGSPGRIEHQHIEALEQARRSRSADRRRQPRQAAVASRSCATIKNLRTFKFRSPAIPSPTAVSAIP